jgi:hypothetical protein
MLPPLKGVSAGSTALAPLGTRLGGDPFKPLERGIAKTIPA